MHASELLHFAFRARDPVALGRWYAELFDGQFFVHPVMSPLGIVIVKLNHPESAFRGLLEFWPWDLQWDGGAAVFRKVDPKPAEVSYGHVALKVALNAEEIAAELEQRGITCHMELRAAGYKIPVVHDPEGNMVELFPNIETIPLPGKAFCPPNELESTLGILKQAFDQQLDKVRPSDGVPLLLFDS